MKTNSMSRIVLALVLGISLTATDCSAQWINVALADLPVLRQMALNLTALAATLANRQTDQSSGSACHSERRG
jgi:hypothetical protein